MGDRDERNFSDQELLELLDKDPDAGLKALMRQYDGLLFTVAHGYVTEAEDIKDCLQETYTDFYLHRDRFDPEKGSLKSYLSVIVKRKAIRQYGEKLPEGGGEMELENLADRSDFISQFEQRSDLEEALASLGELDERILRMKYFEGKSLKEIAEEEELSYEMVKKRQQRSLKKLWKLLILVLVLALLSACVHMVLRYFGFIPGYGINTDAEARHYILEETVTVEFENQEIFLKDAYYDGSMLKIEVLIDGQITPDELSSNSKWSIPEITDGYKGNMDSMVASAPYPRTFYCKECTLPEPVDGRITLTLQYKGMEIPFAMVEAEEHDLQEEPIGFSQLSGENGGILAIPRIEKGELVVSIFPLNGGTFGTYPFLNRNFRNASGGKMELLTVTTADGRVLEGKPENYSPMSTSAYLDWYFGPAEPGTYTLHIPYVYQYAPELTEGYEQKPMGVELPLSEENIDLNQEIEIPGGVLKLGKMTPYTPSVEEIYFDPAALEDGSLRCWRIETEAVLDDPEHVLAEANLSHCTDITAIPEGGVGITDFVAWIEPDAEGYQMMKGFILMTNSTKDVISLAELDRNSVYYRWNHPFDIEMKVEPEEKGETFILETDYGVLSAEPRRVNDQVTVSVYPEQFTDRLCIIPEICHSSLPTAGQQRNLSLIGEDGTSYEGTFVPGREENYSDWKFGDIPAGNYKLHISQPYLKTEETVGVAIPLPKEGETLKDLGEVRELGGSIRLDEISWLGTMDPNMQGPYQEMGRPYTAIGKPTGSLVSTEEVPYMAELKLTMLPPDWGDITLIHTQPRLSGKSGEMDAQCCIPVYEWSEKGGTLKGFQLVYVPELERTVIEFADCVYLLDQEFEIPVTIP